MRNSRLMRSFVFGLLALIACQAYAANPFGIEMPELDDWGAVAHEDAGAGFVFRNSYSVYFFQEVHKYDNPRLGYSLIYASHPGTIITVYVYGDGMESIPDGITSPRVKKQLNSADKALTQSGQYLSVVEETRPDLSFGFLQAFHLIKLKNGAEVKSYTLLRAQNQHFVKVRITGQSFLMEPRVSEFLCHLEIDLGIRAGVQPGAPECREYAPNKSLNTDASDAGAG